MKPFNRILSTIIVAMGVSITVPAIAETPQEIAALTQKAEAGNINAQFDLAGIYYVQQDYTKAKYWIEKVAVQGYADAQTNLGALYHNGQGVTQDYTKARQWYEKAAAQGIAEAQYNLGVLYNYGQGVAKNYTKAKQYFKQACDNGYSLGCDALKELQKSK